MNLDHAIPLFIAQVNGVIAWFKFVVFSFHAPDLICHVDIGFQFVTGRCNTSVIDEDINSTVMGDDSINGGVKRLRIRHIKNRGLARHLVGDRSSSCFVDVIDHDVGAVGS